MSDMTWEERRELDTKLTDALDALVEYAGKRLPPGYEVSLSVMGLAGDDFECDVRICLPSGDFLEFIPERCAWREAVEDAIKHDKENPDDEVE